MKIKIFAEELPNGGGAKDLSVTTAMENSINAFLEKHPDSTVQWLQTATSAVGVGGNMLTTSSRRVWFITLTAIVTYDISK